MATAIHVLLATNGSNLLSKLDSAVIKRIMRYIDNPSAKNWDDAHSILIRGFTTLWQAVVALDPSFRQIGIPYAATKRMPRAEKRWWKWPDALLTVRAIKHALEK